ncbi:MAG: 16S rRNA (guanine(527)-N(7))-methyltransferase RsmG [Rhodobacter sp.]|nr:16S rRNA (guanine(527)-N(7))-methyltransferase RsmG [Rhodobacter sp.]
MSENVDEILRRTYNVSRETTDRLQVFADLLLKWSPRINLISRSTAQDLWHRHIQDSAAVFAAASPNARTWIDLGTGGGFPGAVVALMAAESNPGLRVTCVECDIRKAMFLKTVSRETGVAFAVLSRRIEEVPGQAADVVSARALAPMDRLLGYAERHMAETGEGLFLKGENWPAEVEKALEKWRFKLEKKSSATNPGSAVLIVKDLARA